ncbi:MAG TPA: hypothetical protein PKM88_02280 [bacterium]|nr:hypothetical protein [bacterium]
MRYLRQMPGWLAGVVFAMLAILLIQLADITSYPTLSGVIMMGLIVAAIALMSKP